MKRIGLLFLVVSLSVITMLVVRGVAIRYIISSDRESEFSEVQLTKGLDQDTVVETLGEPDFVMHQPARAGEPATELIGYTRGKHGIELTFVEGSLTSWVETRPIDLKTLDTAPTQPIPCCGSNATEGEAAD